MPLPSEASANDFKPQPIDKRKAYVELMPAGKARSELGKYRLLSATAGIKVSPICVGSFSLGDQYTGFLGTPMNYEQSEKFLNTFYELGGNFIDTANSYQDEQSEHIIGEWMEKRDIRHEMVIATKYTTFYLDRADAQFGGLRVNFGGNSRKSLHVSVERSLKKLRTTYIDVFYLHWWDYTTSVPEVMNALNDLVKAGKVLYLGVSDTPAWIVQQANDYARQHGLTPFSVYQGMWNLGMRDLERDIIPMCRANGMSITPFGVMGSGMFRTPEELKKRGDTLRMGMPPSEKDLKLGKVLQEVAEEIGGGVNLGNVALAWARHKVADCIPVIGGTNPDNLRSNVEALKIRLTEDQVSRLEAAVPFDFGFPFNILGRDPHYLPDGQPEFPGFKTLEPVVFNRLP